MIQILTVALKTLHLTLQSIKLQNDVSKHIKRKVVGVVGQDGNDMHFSVRQEVIQTGKLKESCSYNKQTNVQGEGRQ